MLPIKMSQLHDCLTAGEAEKGTTVPRKRKMKWNLVDT